MKKLFYLSVAFLLSTSLVNATNTKKELSNDNKDTKIETKKKLKDGKVLLEIESSIATKYKGICRDGTTFTFSARNRDEAQGYVNGYCAGIREATETTELN